MLGNFVPPPNAGKAGTFNPKENYNKPLILVIREFRQGFTTRTYPEPKDVVIYDVVDLLANGGQGIVIPSVITGSAAMVDRLKAYVPNDGRNGEPVTHPEPLPVMIVQVVPQGGGRTYYSVEPLEGQALALAVAWDNRFGMARIDHERGQAIAEAARAAAAQNQQNGAVQGAQGQQYQAPLNGMSQQNGGAPKNLTYQGQPFPGELAQPQYQGQPVQYQPQQDQPQYQAPAAAAPAQFSTDADLEAAIALLNAR